MKKNKSNIKHIIYVLLAIASFVLILLFCIEHQADGIPILIGLIVHTCTLLLLYRDALIENNPEDWEDESDWMNDLPADTETSDELEKATDSIETNIPKAVVICDESDEYAENATRIQKSPKQMEDEKKRTATENFFKDVYAEVRESLVSDLPFEEAPTTSPTEIPEETLFPPLAEEEKEPPLPKEVRTFLNTPRDVVEMDLISAAREAMESLQSFADRQKIKLNLSTTCETLMMKADPASIRILFRNIIDNSIKYMGRPGHMIITISLLGDDIFLILKDTGLGLSEDETEHVFELNFQGSNRVSGNGLGLTQTKMIVEAFGGTIYAKSSPGNGMAIYIQLPVSGSAPQ